MEGAQAEGPDGPQEQHLQASQDSPTALDHRLQDAHSHPTASGAQAEQMQAVLHDQQRLLEATAERAAAAEQTSTAREDELQQIREQLRQARQEAEMATGWVRQLAHAVEQAQRQAAAAEAAAADRCEEYRSALAALSARLGDMQGQLRAAEGRAAEAEREAATLRQWLQAAQRRLAATEAALLGQRQLRQQQQQQQQMGQKRLQHQAGPMPLSPQAPPNKTALPPAALPMLPAGEPHLRLHAVKAQAGPAHSRRSLAHQLMHFCPSAVACRRCTVLAPACPVHAFTACPACISLHRLPSLFRLQFLPSSPCNIDLPQGSGHPPRAQGACSTPTASHRSRPHPPLPARLVWRLLGPLHLARRQRRLAPRQAVAGREVRPMPAALGTPSPSPSR